MSFARKIKMTTENVVAQTEKKTLTRITFSIFVE